jgi:protein TonB
MPFLSRAHSWLAALGAAAAALLVACNATPPGAPAPGGKAPLPNTVPPPAVGPAAAPAPTATMPRPAARPTNSAATTAKAYRHDAASHLYAANADRIYKGMLQPNLYAIGVLEVDIDRQGNVTAINWRRAPNHVPEVMAEIVRTVRAAAPYPVPTRMGKVTYTDIWLWDKSGKFQLDTLTEGQL